MTLAIVILVIAYIAIVIFTSDSPKLRRVPRRRMTKKQIEKELHRLMVRGDF